MAPPLATFRGPMGQSEADGPLQKLHAAGAEVVRNPQVRSKSRLGLIGFFWKWIYYEVDIWNNYRIPVDIWNIEFHEVDIGSG